MNRFDFSVVPDTIEFRVIHSLNPELDRARVQDFVYRLGVTAELDTRLIDSDQPTNRDEMQRILAYYMPPTFVLEVLTPVTQPTYFFTLNLPLGVSSWRRLRTQIITHLDKNHVCRAYIRRRGEPCPTCPTDPSEP